MFADTHCHLDFEQYENDRELVIKRAIEEKVQFIINPGIDLDSSRKALEISSRFERVYPLCGIHPHNASKTDEMEFAECMKLIKSNRVAGIGETGLDFYYQHSDMISQVSLFKKHLQFAKKNNMPLVVHQRSADKQIVEIFEDAGYPSRVVFHCFDGSKEMFEWVMKKGFYISFTGILTFKNAIELRGIAEKVNLDKVFFETDSPYLAPHPLRGRRNEPRFVRFIVEEFARIRKMPVDEVATITTNNAKRFFGIS